MKVKTLVLLSSIFMLGLWSCSNDKDVVNPDPNPDPEEVVNKYITGVDLSKSYSLPNNHEVGHSVYNVLGYGYDVTGKYAHPTSIKSVILDVAKLKEEDEFAVRREPRFAPNNLGVLQGTKEDVLKDLSFRRNLLQNEIRNYQNRVFVGMFIQPFENDIAFNEINYYYSFLANIKAWYVLDIDVNSNCLSRYITDDFKKDITQLSGQEIIKKYGTHILTGIEIGRREDFIYRSSSKKQLQLGLLVRPEQVFDKKPVSFLYPTMGETYDKENIYHEMIGFSTPEINAWMVDFTNYTIEKAILVDDFGEIKEEEAVLVDFNRNNPLTPIYEVIQDETKQKEVKEAFEKYLSE